MGTSTSTSYTVTGLSAATAYSFTVRAKDAAGNVSAASAAVSATTQSGTSTGACSVKYTASSWNTGFTASVKVTNTGKRAALSSWTLGFSFDNGQTVTQGWSAEWSQSGPAVTREERRVERHPGSVQSVDIRVQRLAHGTNNAPHGLHDQRCCLHHRVI